MQDVHEQLARAGLMVEGELEVGRLVRCPVDGDKGGKRSGWYVLHEFRLDNGDTRLVGSFGNWKASDQPEKVELELPEASDEERKRYREQMQAVRDQASAEKKERSESAAKRAENIWPKLPEEGSSQYLQRKKVGAFGLRFSRGSVVVPLVNESDKLVGLQWIDGDGKKTFLTGTAKRGAFHVVGGNVALAEGDSEPTLAIAEGYATAASVHLATGWPVAVAFDAGNLKPVAQVMRSRYPSGVRLAVCADHDHKQGSQAWGCAECGWLVLELIGTRSNPNYHEHERCPKCNGAKTGRGGVGLIKALSAAHACGGVVYCPRFPGDLEDPGSDFNDLHLLAGLEEVSDQLTAGEPVRSLDRVQSPAPSEKMAARPNLDAALQRFAWTIPDGKILDTRDKKLLKPAQVKNWLGPKVYQQWLEHDDRKVIEHDEAARLAATAARKGAGDLADSLERYVLLYPSQTAWDGKRREVIALNDLKPKLHRWYTNWLEHPDRKEIDRDCLVFDPSGEHDGKDGYINMFRGLPLRSGADPAGCKAIVELVRSLCNAADDDDPVFSWLMCWLAYPLQHVGAKMATAVLMHAETQGSGKSLLFEEVIKPIYGEYAATLGQHQLESQYTDWQSQRLFGLFEEVFSRDQKYSHTGTLKHMITGKTMRIEKKFVSGWEEANHLNAVFLSNEVQPFPVEPSDRRMLVVWPRSKLEERLRLAVLEELQNGGVEAFYQYLLDLSLWWHDPDAGAFVKFDQHTKPPMTEAKRRLIDFGRPSWDTFLQDWQEAALDAEPRTCLTTDLFRLYRRWARQRNENTVSHTKFSQLVATRIRKRSGIRFEHDVISGKGTFFILDDPPANVIEAQWFGEQVVQFRRQAKLEQEIES